MGLPSTEDCVILYLILLVVDVAYPMEPLTIILFAVIDFLSPMFPTLIYIFVYNICELIGLPSPLSVALSALPSLILTYVALLGFYLYMLGSIQRSRTAHTAWILTSVIVGAIWIYGSISYIATSELDSVMSSPAPWALIFVMSKWFAYWDPDHVFFFLNGL